MSSVRAACPAARHRAWGRRAVNHRPGGRGLASLVRMVCTAPANPTGRWPRQIRLTIDAQHIDEPGLVVLDITAANEETAHAVMADLEQRWATSGITPVRSEPGVPGVRARVYADIQRLAP
ncbi:DUF6207 family protein [Streptomyces sp. NPDC002540]